MASKKKIQTKLTPGQKKQLSKLLAVVRKFPRKKKTDVARADFGPGEVSGLVNQWKLANAQFLAAQKMSDLFKTQTGLATFNRISNAFSTAQTNLIRFLAANPDQVKVAKNLGYPP